MPAQICMKLLLLVFVSLLLTSCAPRSEPVLDEATVVAKNASLRLKNSSTSRTLRVLDTGEKVDVLEHQDNWYRVRYGPEVQGWMEESTVVTNETKDRIQKLAACSFITYSDGRTQALDLCTQTAAAGPIDLVPFYILSSTLFGRFVICHRLTSFILRTRFRRNEKYKISLSNCQTPARTNPSVQRKNA